MHEYVLALIGGVMIGLAALMLMATRGEIMGVSGIVRLPLPNQPVSLSFRCSSECICRLFRGVEFHSLPLKNPFRSINEKT